MGWEAMVDVWVDVEDGRWWWVGAVVVGGVSVVWTVVWRGWARRR
jgi:hypothetical protein